MSQSSSAQSVVLNTEVCKTKKYYKTAPDLTTGWSIKVPVMPKNAQYDKSYDKKQLLNAAYKKMLCYCLHDKDNVKKGI